jgi:hypothetical protein
MRFSTRQTTGFEFLNFHWFFNGIHGIYHQKKVFSGRVPMLINKGHQPKVVLPTCFWTVGVDEWRINNMNFILPASKSDIAGGSPN